MVGLIAGASVECPLLDVVSGCVVVVNAGPYTQYSKDNNLATTETEQRVSAKLSIESHLEIRTAEFLQAFSATKNTLCLLFKHCAVTQLNSIFDKYKPNVIHSDSQLARILRYDLR